MLLYLLYERPIYWIEEVANQQKKKITISVKQIATLFFVVIENAMTWFLDRAFSPFTTHFPLGWSMQKQISSLPDIMLLLWKAYAAWKVFQTS